MPITKKEKGFRLLDAITRNVREVIRKDQFLTEYDTDLIAGSKTTMRNERDQKRTDIFKLINTLQALVGTTETGTFTDAELEAMGIYPVP